MKIDLGKDFRPDKLIEKDVNAGQCTLILDNDDIQRPVVNT
jgi:hypothetical protein